MTSANSKGQYRYRYFLVFLIPICSVLIYLDSMNAPLTFWDDIRYVTNNKLIRSLGLDNIRAIFSNFYHTDYQPVQLLSYSIDYFFWGMNPVGYHITNLLLHISNGIFVYFFALRIKKEYTAAALASLIFIVMPGHVESVAWISERKILLSVFFMMLSLFKYMDYIDSKKESKPDYLLCMVCFTFALLSKAAVVIFPLLLIMIDLYRREREIIANKIPLFLLSLIDSYLTILSQGQSGAIKGYYGGHPFYTFLTMCKVFVHYFTVMFLPFNLNTKYDFEITKSILDPHFILAASVLGVILLTAFLSFHRNRFYFLLILSFFASIIPVSNIIPISILFAERYLYIPAIYFSIAIGSTSAAILKGPRRIKAASGVLILISVLLMSILTINRNKYWNDPVVLWTDAAVKSPYSSSIFLNLGYAYIEKNNYRKALEVSRKGIRLNPANKKVVNNIGTCYGNLGMYNKAAVYFREASRLDNRYLEPILNLARIFYKKRLYEKASYEYERYLKLDRNDPSVFYYLGMSNMKMGRFNKAEGYFIHLLKINKFYLKSLINLGLANKEMGKMERALAYYEKAVSIGHKTMGLHIGLGNILYLLDRKEEAFKEYKKEVLLSKNDAGIFFNIGLILYRNKEYTEAVKYFKGAIELNRKGKGAYQLIVDSYKRIGDIPLAEYYYTLAKKNGLTER